jgi:hypothetical protein
MFVLFKFIALFFSSGQPLPVHQLIVWREGILSIERAALEGGPETGANNYTPHPLSNRLNAERGNDSRHRWNQLNEQRVWSHAGSPRSNPPAPHVGNLNCTPIQGPNTR